MAHVPMGDITEMWNQAPHNWSGLRDWLRGHEGKAEGIDNALIPMMIQVTEKKGNASFPSNPQDLYNEMNQHVEAHR